jgi:hypothetical protein
MRPRAAVCLCALALLTTAGVARADSVAPGGLRGLVRTHSADVAGRGVLEWGAFASAHTLDDSTGATKAFLVAPLQVGYGLSRYLEIGVALPVRAWTSFGGTPVAGIPDGQAGFGDLEAAAKLQVPIPGRTVRLGLDGGAAFPTGSRPAAARAGSAVHAPTRRWVGR